MVRKFIFQLFVSCMILSTYTCAQSLIIGEVPSGTTNGSNAVFTLQNTPSSNVAVYKNGIRQQMGLDYSISGNQIIFATNSIPLSTDTLTADYTAAQQVSGNGVHTSAVFVSPADTTTQGNWVGTYGTDGYIIPNDTSNPAVYSTVNFNGASTYTWANPTSDTRALLASNSGTNRIASMYCAGSTFTIDVNLTDNQQHQLALYLLDFDGGRAETISILNAANNAVLDTETASNFMNGEYLLWNVQGHVLVQVTRTAGVNAEVSGLFFATPTISTQAPPPVVSVVAPTVNQQVSGNFTVQASATSTASIASVQFMLDGSPLGPQITQGAGSIYSYQWPTTTATNGQHQVAALATDTLTQNTLSKAVTFTISNQSSSNSAVFVTTDSATQGTWQGKYGSAGEIIANSSNVLPNYATVTMSGANPFTWTFTPDLRALQVVGSTNRIASAFYNSPGLSINVNLTDGNTHQLALYLLDWDHSGRAETISILDPSNNNVLDTRAISEFTGGVYLVWNIHGSVVVQLTGTAGPNAVVSGLFLQ